VIRSALARALERGTLRSPLARAASRMWERRAEVVRVVPLPVDSAVIGVGGATLGGSYKTPLTLALAVALGRRGESVRVVGHGYGARVRGARTVHASDSVRRVGDDAAWLARELASEGVSVVTGERAAALELAARPGSVVLVDGLLQARPRRVALALLAVDARSPWGSDACPPAGDRRAARAALLAATDAIVAVGDGVREHGALADIEPIVPVFDVRADVRAHFLDGRLLPFSELRGMRVGVVLAIARPERVLGSLSARGIRPALTHLFADHAFPRARTDARGVDVWLTTPKCATKLPGTRGGAPIAVLRQSLALPDALLARCVEAIRRCRG